MRGLNNGLDLLLEWFLILLDIEMYTKSSLEPQNLDQLGFPCITTSRGLREHQGRQAMPAELPIPDSVALRYPRTGCLITVFWPIHAASGTKATTYCLSL